jgi:Putative auto-transporter adhesin, head GIN domain
MMYRMSITRLHSPHSHRAIAVSVLAMLLLSLGACRKPDNSPMATEERQVAGFQSIELRGAAEMAVQVGPAHSLRITASSNNLAKFTSEVQGDKLVLETHNRLFEPQLGKVVVHVTLPSLDSMVISGAGDVKVIDVASDSLTLALNGAANVEANGKATNLAVSMNGAGNMDLTRLEAGSATVAVNGAGSMDVNATGSLNATVNGVGSINYYGKPAQVTTAINGVGSISAHTRDN